MLFHQNYFSFDFSNSHFFYGRTVGMMRVATDAQQQRLHLPMRMMSGRQFTEHKNITNKNNRFIWKHSIIFCIEWMFIWTGGEKQYENFYIKIDYKAKTKLHKIPFKSDKNIKC